MDNNNEVTFGNWMVTMLIMVIPIVNVVMLFVWAFGGGAEKSKSNWAKAQLIWMLIGIVVSVAMSFAMGALIVQFFSNL